MKKVTRFTYVCVLLMLIIPMAVTAGKKPKPPPSQTTPISSPDAQLRLSHTVASIGQLVIADPTGSVAGTYVKQSKKPPKNPKKKQLVVTGDPLVLTWGFDNDWTQVVRPTGEMAGYFKTPGFHTITLTIRDSLGKTDLDSQTVEVKNQFPVANIGVSNTTPKLDEPITVNLLSSDPDEKFGDVISQTLHILKETDQGRVQVGSKSASNFSIVFDSPGTYWLSLVVYDKYNGEGIAETKVVVNNQNPVAVINGPTEKLTLELVTFNSDSHDRDAKGLITESKWFAEDSQDVIVATGTGTSFSHTFATPDTYEIWHKVVDQFGGEDVTSQPFVALNQAPVASFGYTAIGQTYKIDSKSYDPEDGKDVDLEWYQNGTFISIQPSIVRTLLPGNHTFLLKVTDSNGSSASYQSVISTYALNPIARLTATPTEAPSKTPIVLGAGTSTDPNEGGGIVEYQFFDSDRNTQTTQSSQVTWVYTTPGTRTIRVTVKSRYGTTHTSGPITIKITNLLPEVSLTADKYQTLSKTSVRVMLSEKDHDGRIVRHWFKIDAGPWQEVPVANMDFDYLFPKPGVFKMYAKVEDDQGDTAESAPITITIDNRKPSAGFTADKTVVEKGGSITITSTAGDEDGTVDKRDWNISDGRNFSGSSVAVSFNQAGTFAITHTATDNWGDSASSQMTIQVNDTPPPPRWPPSPIYLQQKLDSGSTPPNGTAWDTEKTFSFPIYFVRIDKNGVIHTLPNYAQIDIKTGQLLKQVNIPNNGTLAVDDQGRVYFSSTQSNPAIVQVRDASTLVVITEINVGKNGSRVADIDRDGFLYVLTQNNAGQNVMRVIDTTTLQLARDSEGVIVEWPSGVFGEGVVGLGINIWINIAPRVYHIKRTGGEVTSIWMKNNFGVAKIAIGPKNEIIFINGSTLDYSALNPEHLDDSAPIWPPQQLPQPATAIHGTTITENGILIYYLAIAMQAKKGEVGSSLIVPTWR